MSPRLIEIAVKKAKQSSCTYRVSAIGLNKRGEVVYKAFNKSRFMRPGGAIHAEMEVMLKGGPGVHTIVICRVGNNGDILPIHPCSVCKLKAEELGIRIVSVGI
jgi:Cytidine and deoxycytidylate deaminase zinc-binding region